MNSIEFGTTESSQISLQAASGTDTAGSHLVITSGQGTGTGAGGNIVFQVADGAGRSGSSVNSLATALTIADNGAIEIGGTADGTVRSITFGHATIKTIMGIDDSSDAFVINTDNAFDNTLANNSFSIDASHNAIIAGDLTVVGNDIKYGAASAATLQVLASSGTDTVGGNLTISAGQGTGAATKDASHNIAIGQGAGACLDSGDNNIFLGSQSGQCTYLGAGCNINIGWCAGKANRTGTHNIIMGCRAASGSSNVVRDGRDNVILGSKAGCMLSTGNVNVFLGHCAGIAITTGGYNVGVGYSVGA